MAAILFLQPPPPFYLPDNIHKAAELGLPETHDRTLRSCYLYLCSLKRLCPHYSGYCFLFAASAFHTTKFHLSAHYAMLLHFARPIRSSALCF
ncbi:hypothetical protein H1R20_g11402, partial [Candolleomyces eurysporus]